MSKASKRVKQKATATPRTREYLQREAESHACHLQRASSSAPKLLLGQAAHEGAELAALVRGQHACGCGEWGMEEGGGAQPSASASTGKSCSSKRASHCARVTLCDAGGGKEDTQEGVVCARQSPAA